MPRETLFDEILVWVSVAAVASCKLEENSSNEWCEHVSKLGSIKRLSDYSSKLSVARTSFHDSTAMVLPWHSRAAVALP